jgi:type I restriction enzyme, S subunit
VSKGWAYYEFGQLFDNVTSSSQKLARSRYLTHGRYPVVDQGDEFIGGWSNDETLVHPGPIPVVVYGDHTRAVKLLERPFIQGADGVKILAPRSRVTARFGAWLLRAFPVPSKGYARHFADVRKQRFGIPSRDEQQRIVEAIETHFSRLDAAEASLQRAKANVKRARASVLQAAVEGRLVPIEAEVARAERRKYEPATELLARILAERPAAFAQRGAQGRYKEPVKPDLAGFPQLPDGWCWASVDQLHLEVTDGDHQPPPVSDRGIPFLVIGDVRRGEPDYTNARRVPGSYYDSLSWKRRPDSRDLLYTVVGSLGIPVRVPDDRPFCVQRHIAILKRPYVGLKAYLVLALASSLVFAQAESKATGTAQKTLGLASLRSIAVPLPPMSEQHRIVAEVDRRLSVLDALDGTIERNLVRCARLRQAILQRAFVGRLVPAAAAADDQRASA